MNAIAERLRALDAYPKVARDVRVQTLSGAAVSAVGLVLIAVLCWYEVARFFSVEPVQRLYVDPSHEKQLSIHFNVTFHRIPCSLVSLDAMDVSGGRMDDVRSHVFTQSLQPDGVPMAPARLSGIGETLKAEDLTGKEEEAKEESAEGKKDCGDCYGAASAEVPCCNTCDDVRAAYRAKGWALGDLSRISQCVHSGQTNEAFRKQLERSEGCRMSGFLDVNRVSGNFHFAPGKSFQKAHVHVHDMAAIQAGVFDVSHTVHSLSYGSPYPGVVNPLDGAEWLSPAYAKYKLRRETGATGKDAGSQEEKLASAGGTMVLYYSKIVPTTFHYINGTFISTNQFSATTHTRQALSPSPKEAFQQAGHGLPGVFFFYELSPIRVDVSEQRGASLLHMLARLCAIFGGVLAVTGMIDRFVYAGVKHLQRKVELGKLS